MRTLLVLSASLLAAAPALAQRDFSKVEVKVRKIDLTGKKTGGFVKHD